MHLNDIYHVGLPLYCRVCLLQPGQQHRGSSFAFAAFRSVDTTGGFILLGRAECHGLVPRQAGRDVAETITRFRACLRGETNPCDHTCIITALELKLYNSPCGESLSAIRVPLCGLYCLERYNYNNIVTLMNFST